MSWTLPAQAPDKVSDLGAGVSGEHGGPQDGRGPVEKVRQKFGLARVVLVGVRGMLTQPQNEIKAHLECGWITAEELGGSRIGEAGSAAAVVARMWSCL